ncbi:lipopolysaccharide biosynthesis protein [Limosilactobacillus fermentum]|nr:lipopolysaccharide biosynthesis protein [Limosilactobacillus fermentum]
MKNRYSKLMDNSALFAIANLGTKLIQFFLVPLYTYALSTSAYGTVDLMITTVSMLTPIFSLSIFDAVFRYTMDRDADYKRVFTIGLGVTIIGLLLLGLFVPIFDLLKIPYATYFAIMLGLSLFNSLLQNFARSIGYVKVFAFSGVINALSTTLLSILFLVVLKLGIEGYINSLIISSVITLAFLVIGAQAWKYVSFKTISIEYLKKMLRYCIPLIPNAFSWWFTNDANRYFILLFVGTAGNGLYAVANKMPSILSVLFNIFSQAWQLSAVEEYDSKDKNEFYSNIFNYLMLFLLLGVGAILVVLKPFMSVYTSSSFYESWKIVPFLLMAAVYSNLSGFLGTVFLAAKKTASLFSTTIIGMLLNLIFNVVLIPIIGLNGAGLGSAIGFIIVSILRLRKASKEDYVKINVDTKMCLTSHVLIILMIVGEFAIGSLWLLVGIELVLLIAMAVLNLKFFKVIFGSLILKGRK